MSIQKEPKVGSSTTSSTSATRKHVTNACQNCKRQHLKCSYEYPCQNCKSKGIECLKTERKTRKKSAHKTSNVGVPASSLLPDTSSQSSGDESFSPTFLSHSSSPAPASPVSTPRFMTSPSTPTTPRSRSRSESVLPATEKSSTASSSSSPFFPEQAKLLGSCYWTRSSEAEPYRPSFASGIFLEVVQATGGASEFSKLSIDSLFQGEHDDPYLKRMSFRSFSKDVRVACSPVDTNTVLTNVYTF